MSDVAIVGAGVAGCAAAATALELGYTVVVYEAGPGEPLPAILRSPDLNRASEVRDWWWPGSYPCGHGVGGGSAVNGMIVQQPARMDDALWWAWAGFDPVRAELGPLAERLNEVAATNDEATVEAAWLSLRNGRRRTAADVWLKPHPNLSVESGVTVSGGDVRAWSSDGRLVLVAAGTLRSPELVGLQADAPRDHQSAVVAFEVPSELRSGGGDAPAGTALIRFGDVQILVLEHTDGSKTSGALIVSAMVDTPGPALLARGIGTAIDLLDSLDIEGTLVGEPAPVAHACCTLAGLDTPVPVVDASTLPELPAVNPMLSVAAHARRETWRALYPAAPAQPS